MVFIFLAYFTLYNGLQCDLILTALILKEFCLLPCTIQDLFEKD